MKQIFFVPIIIMTLMITSCETYSGEFREIENDHIEISLPDWLLETDDLAPHAYYQFKSNYRNTYGIVVRTDKENRTLEEYQKEGIGVLRNYKELTNLLVTDSVKIENSINLELMGDMESEKLFYWHNTYESQGHFYQLVVWTRSYDRKQKYSEVIEKVIASFEMKD
ncbi:MAG: hypothetical protein ACI8ZX_001602 [Planctomycetota bacterium]|jgi:hypothetical protein